MLPSRTDSTHAAIACDMSCKITMELPGHEVLRPQRLHGMLADMLFRDHQHSKVGVCDKLHQLYLLFLPPPHFCPHPTPLVHFFFISACPSISPASVSHFVHLVHVIFRPLEDKLMSENQSNQSTKQQSAIYPDMRKRLPSNQGVELAGR